jgi:hypothetical protein
LNFGVLVKKKKIYPWWRLLRGRLDPFFPRPRLVICDFHILSKLFPCFYFRWVCGNYMFWRLVHVNGVCVFVCSLSVFSRALLSQSRRLSPLLSHLIMIIIYFLSSATKRKKKVFVLISTYFFSYLLVSCRLIFRKIYEDNTMTRNVPIHFHIPCI